jgi:hypothetical protein
LQKLSEICRIILNDIQQTFRNKREVIHESKEINELAMNPINNNIGD